MNIVMDYECALGYIGSLKSFNGAPTLERMRKLMRLLGDPQRTRNIVHVAGTNGKGSTAAMIASILRAAGIKTGLTVSPYIVDFCERIQINGEMIPRELLAREISLTRNAADKIGGITQFEVITAAAYAYFARENCGVVVTEVGLGGRFDATNVIEHPLVSVITSIGLDHTAILGDTIEQIATEKCGIIKSDSPVVCSPNQRPAALGVIRGAAQERGCELTEVSISDISGLSMTLNGSEFTYKGSRIHLPLIGRHQVANALTAIEAVAALAHNGFAAGDADCAEAVSPASTTELWHAAVSRGLAAVRFPARLELMREDPPVLLDGAHNPDGMRSLAEAFELLGGRPVTAVLGMLADKDVETAIAVVASGCRRIFCVTPKNPRSLAAEELSEIARKYCGDVAVFEDTKAAIAAAVAEATRERGAAIIGGSLYLAAEVRPMLPMPCGSGGA